MTPTKTRSKYRAVKVLVNESQEVAVKPLAVFLYDLFGETHKAVVHWEPFGGDKVCLSDFRSGHLLASCDPFRAPVAPLLGSLKGDLRNEDRGLWIEIGTAFLHHTMALMGPVEFSKNIERLHANPALNGSNF